MDSILKLRFPRTIRLYCFTDVHLGAVEHDSVKFQKALKALKKDKDAYCFWNGDNVECIPPEYGIHESGQTKGPDEQIRELRGILKGLGDKTIFIRNGNHDERAWNLSGINIAGQLGSELGINVLRMGMVETWITIGKRKFRIVTTHGEGGSSLRVLEKIKQTFQGADLYFVGHSHELFDKTGVRVDTSSGEEVIRPFLQILGGSFLEWADYARDLNRVPTMTGCYVLELSEKGGLVVKERI